MASKISRFFKENIRPHIRAALITIPIAIGGFVALVKISDHGVSFTISPSGAAEQLQE